MLKQYIETINKFKPDLIKAFIETIDMMTTSLLVTLLLGLLLGFLLFLNHSQGHYKNRYIYFIFSALVNIIRSIPFILFIIVIIPFNRSLLGTGFGVDASKIPLSLVGIALFARLVEKDLLDVDRNLYETSYSLGANKLQYFKSFLLREARSSLVLSFTSSAISLLSYSTVMGIIGGGGLGYLAISEGYYNFNYKLMWLIIFIMIIIVQFIQNLGNIISKILNHK